MGRDAPHTKAPTPTTQHYQLRIPRLSQPK
jgi:hypothetical protein